MSLGSRKKENGRKEKRRGQVQLKTYPDRKETRRDVLALVFSPYKSQQTGSRWIQSLDPHLGLLFLSLL